MIYHLYHLAMTIIYLLKKVAPKLQQEMLKLMEKLYLDKYFS